MTDNEEDQGLRDLLLVGAGAILAYKPQHKQYEAFYTSWSPTAQKYENRAKHMDEFNIKIPAQTTPEIVFKTCKDAVNAYCFELDVAATITAVLAFEIALKNKYLQKEGKKTKKSLSDLIDWAEDNKILDSSDNDLDEANAIRKIRTFAVHEGRVLRQVEILSIIGSSFLLIEKMYSGLDGILHALRKMNEEKNQ